MIVLWLWLYHDCDLIMIVIVLWLWLYPDCDCIVIVSWLWFSYDCDYIMIVIVLWLWLYHDCDLVMIVIVLWFWLYYDCDCIMIMVVSDILLLRRVSDGKLYWLYYFPLFSDFLRYYLFKNRPELCFSISIFFGSWIDFWYSWAKGSDIFGIPAVRYCFITYSETEPIFYTQ